MIETLGSISNKEWDAWRSDPLTKLCIEVLIFHTEKKCGGAAAHEVEENFPELFADPARQARYSQLRGKIDGVKELMEVLKLPLSDLTDSSETTDEKN